jgi:tRNA nucleotidyltransferase (CCA-adding enzyme)
MKKMTNLVELIRQRLPHELVEFMQLAGDAAAKQAQRLYLVGGVVRDLLLERPNCDLDLVAELDAIKLAETLAKLKGGKVIAHSRFNTAKIVWDKWSVDIATARAESYAKPGALPSVQCRCDIRNDLRRRDFTINAMAVDLDPAHFSELIDLHGGVADLEKGLVRILHDGSFQDDATRIWRAVRYEQRLDFRIERHTLAMLRRDLDYLDPISGDRIRHELELCLAEDKPEKALLRAENLGLLVKINPALEADNWTAKKMVRARTLIQPYCPPADLFLAFLVYRLPLQDLEELIVYLNFPRSAAQTLRETLQLKSDLDGLAGPRIPPSTIYRSLHRFGQNAILANLIASDVPVVRERIELYLNHLRHVRTIISGADLVKHRIARGPHVKEVLEQVLLAKLDNKAATEAAELAFAQRVSTPGDSLREKN